ncbi:HAD family acid phosphatase [Streptomyces sp. 8L]|uniref:HAD family acid phosphatase n=1 Tax=unclassified Streptomyces TaxID=2593676 RepID=UPI001CD60BB4|nr:HAD family acid phosphatase [Streptomyces sp. 8L]MCA1218631.1 Secreted acid phosphatase [Streptomyces sp. 8L]
MRKFHQVAATLAACALTGGILYGTGVAGADTGHHGHPGSEPENIGLLTGQIDDYYGATQAADGTWQASPDSPYAHDLARIEAGAERDIARETAGHHGPAARHGKPAIVLDVDDTALLSFTYERETNYVYNDATWNAFVSQADRPAVYGMPGLVSYAKKHGVTVFFLTGLAENLREPAVDNLRKVGYHTDLDQAHLFTKDKTDPPAYLADCATAAAWNCTTVQFKSETREHLEASGYDIIGNFGDQQSDLTGGHADHTYKLPNPTYFVE